MPDIRFLFLSNKKLIKVLVLSHFPKTFTQTLNQNYRKLIMHFKHVTIWPKNQNLTYFKEKILMQTLKEKRAPPTHTNKRPKHVTIRWSRPSICYNPTQSKTQHSHVKRLLMHTLIKRGKKRRVTMIFFFSSNKDTIVVPILTLKKIPKKKNKNSKLLTHNVKRMKYGIFNSCN